MMPNTQFEKTLDLFKTKSFIFPNDFGSLTTVQDTTPISEVLKRLISRKILAVPVVNSKSEIVTIVTMLDIIATIIKHLSVHEITKFDMNWLEKKNAFANLTASRIRTSKIEAVHVITEDKSILDAAHEMKSNGCHRVLVIDDQNRPTSIITQSRIIRLAAVCLDSIPNADKTIAELYLDKTKIVYDDENTIVLDAFNKMVSKNMSAIAIINSEGELVGTISETDIRQIGYDFKFFFYLSFTCKEFLNHMKIYDPLRTIPDSNDPIAVWSHTRLGDVIKKLVFYNIHRVFVIDEHKKPISVVSLTDIIPLIV